MHCAFECSAVNCLLFVCGRVVFITLLLRMLSMFVLGGAGFLVSVKAYVLSKDFVRVLSPEPQSMRVILWGFV